MPPKGTKHRPESIGLMRVVQQNRPPKCNADFLGRFWKRVAVKTDDECWPWLGSIDSDGYGAISSRIASGKITEIKAHRFAWILTTKRSIPSSDLVAHLCERRDCVNPQHLTMQHKSLRSDLTRQRIRRAGADRSPAPKSIQKPTIRDLAWMAGFMEGEGHFCGITLGGGGDRAVAVQVNKAPIDRIVALFGGTAYLRKKDPPCHDVWCWQVSGARARGLMMTLYPLMTPLRQSQIRVALKKECNAYAARTSA